MHAMAHRCGQRRTSGADPRFLPLRQGAPATCLMSIWGLSCLYLHRNLRVTDTHQTSAFYFGSRDPNSGLHTCAALSHLPVPKHLPLCL